jgi:hypothetical protein
MILFNNKGQSDTVFEVLIAVILLGFVLTAGGFAMNSLSNTKCSKEIDLSLLDLKRNIEEGANSPLISTKFTIYTPNCFGTNYKISLQRSDDLRLCTSYCPGSTSNCFLLRYENDKDKASQVRYNCVNISPAIILSGDGEELDGYNIINPSQNSIDMNNGTYLIKNNTFANESGAPKIYFYKVAR